jgi:hypothetical protein
MINGTVGMLIFQQLHNILPYKLKNARKRAKDLYINQLPDNFLKHKAVLS